MRARSALGIVLATFVFSSPINGAANAAEFSGKTVTFVIPFAPGGGSDIWGRFNAGFLQKYLPGRPNVIVSNQPGAGSLSAANQFAATAKPDGLTIFGTSSSTQFPYLLGETRAKYDYKKWNLVLAAPTGGVVYVSSRTGVRSLQDLGKSQLQYHYASQGLTSGDLVPLLAFRLLGLDVKHVVGFPGRNEARLAFERGETNIDYQTTSGFTRSVTPLIKNGAAVPLFSWGVLGADGRISRDPNFPDLPSVEEAYEIVRGQKPSGLEWDAFRAFLLAGFAAQKLIVLPAGTPDDIVEAYRKAVRDLRKDPEYLGRRDDLIGEYEQLTDAEGERLYAAATTISTEAREWVRSLLTREYSVKFD
jgi:tripartite-type tricarboxylate transporter receptor subunit TctC